MVKELSKILRLVEKELITKEQGYILIKALYERKINDFDYTDMDDSALNTEREEAIGNTAELLEELFDAAASDESEWTAVTEYKKNLEEFLKNVISDDSKDDSIEESKEDDGSDADNENYVKKDYYLAGEKVYDQRNVSLKRIRRGTKYKANFFVYEIKGSNGECIPDKKLRSAALSLIEENFCGRYRKIKNGGRSVIKIFIE